MSDRDYIELTDLKEIIREGDGITFKDSPWRPVTPGLIGTQVGEHPTGFRFRRPRSTVIRDAAIELLREHYRLVFFAKADVALFEKNFPLDARLRIALGLTVEELRGDA